MTYPIFGLLCCVPFALLPLPAADTAWDLFQVVLLAGTALLVVFGYRPRGDGSDAAPSLGFGDRTPLVAEADLHRYWPLIAPLLVATFTCRPVLICSGNIQQLNLFGVTLLGVALLRGRETSAGFILRRSAGSRCYPSSLIPALWVAGKRRTVTVCEPRSGGMGSASGDGLVAI
jgi:hypothetical protein